MINIRPTSDLRNKFNEIEEMVLEGEEEIYLTKNGYGAMVVLKLEKYSELMDEIKINRMLDEKFRKFDLNKQRIEEDNQFLTGDTSNAKAKRITTTISKM